MWVSQNLERLTHTADGEAWPLPVMYAFCASVHGGWYIHLIHHKVGVIRERCSILYLGMATEILNLP